MTLRAVATAAAATAVGVLLAATPAQARDHAPVQREHTVTTVPVHGNFICGALALSVNAGTETEIFDAVLENGIVRIRISRSWQGVTLTGSDGRTYRASGQTHARFVLVDPDFDNPVWGRELIIVRFRSGPQRSTLYLREEIKIRHGSESDVVSGSCDFAP